MRAARAAATKKAVDILVLDMQGIFTAADYFVICSGRNTPQIAAITRETQDDLEKQQIRPYRKQGTPESGWVLLDYEDVIVHIFSEEARAFYNLEHLWGDAKIISKDL